MAAPSTPKVLAVFTPEIGAARSTFSTLETIIFAESAALFKSNKTTIIPRQKPTELIANGPFRVSRNPIYLGFLLIVLGIAVYTGSWIALIAPIWYFFFLRKNYVLPEERKMVEGLGDVATDYFERTGRWVWFL